MKLVIPAGAFESVVSLAVEALRGQIDILNVLGYSSLRHDLIRRLKSQAMYLYELLEKNEEFFIDTIEGFSEELLGQNAEIRDGLINVSTITGDPELKNIAGIVTDAHKNTVKFLAENEKIAIKNVRERISSLKEDVKKLQTQIDDLRIR